MISDVTGVLLAGGKSRRMGEDKRFLSVGNETLLERSLSVIRQNFNHVCVVIAQDSASLNIDVPVFRDLISECGSLGGLYTALKSSNTPHVFLAACDMPFLNPLVINYLVGLREEADIVVVRSESGLQSTHAVYSQSCRLVIEDMLKNGRLSFRELIQSLGTGVRVVDQAELRFIDPWGYSFLNVNTPEDLAFVRGLRPPDTTVDRKLGM